MCRGKRSAACAVRSHAWESRAAGRARRARALLTGDHSRQPHASRRAPLGCPGWTAPEGAIPRIDVSNRYIAKICRTERCCNLPFGGRSPPRRIAPPAGPSGRADGGRLGLGAVTNASYSVWDGTQEMRGRLRACPQGNACLGIGWPHHRRGRLRRASLSAPCREVPRRGDEHRMPDLPPVPAHPRDLRVWGRTRTVRRPGEAGARTGRDGHGIWGVPGVRRRGLPELWLEPPRFVLRTWHGRAARPAWPAWVPNSE